MGKVIEFPSRFNPPDEPEGKKDEAKKEEENIAEQRTEDGPKNTLVTKEKRKEISDKLRSFHSRMKTIRETNTRILWSGNTAREMDQLVRSYTPHQLMAWIWNIDDQTILQKPLFFNAISAELLRRGFAPDIIDKLKEED